MKVVLNREEIEKIIRDNIDTPRMYEIDEVTVFIDNDVEDTSDMVKAEIFMSKEAVL